MPRKNNDIVKLTLDPHHLPPLTEAQKVRLDAVAAMPFEDIDYSDAPARPGAIWKKPLELAVGKAADCVVH